MVQIESNSTRYYTTHKPDRQIEVTNCSPRNAFMFFYRRQSKFIRENFHLIYFFIGLNILFYVVNVVNFLNFSVNLFSVDLLKIFLVSKESKSQSEYIHIKQPCIFLGTYKSKTACTKERNTLLYHNLPNTN